MKLKPDEQRMLDGLEGPAKKAAMEFLVAYGEALGAEELLDTNNVHSLLMFTMYPDTLSKHLDINDIDAFISKSVLNTDERIVVDKVKAFTTTHIPFIDMNYAGELECSVGRDPENMVDYVKQLKKYCERIGMTMVETCTPFTAGNMPVKGQHLAWTESSAIAFANSVIGARTNIEGDHSSFAAAITGKTLNWGLHLDENRLGNVIVNVKVQPKNMLDWALLGFYTGLKVGLNNPVFCNVQSKPEIEDLLALAAAGCTSGAVIMFHIVGVTPEASTLEEAVGNREIVQTIEYGEEERRAIYERLNFGKSKEIGHVLIGCPHLTINQLNHIASLLDGKKTKVNLMLFTNDQTKKLAMKTDVYDKISNAGGKIVVDSCPVSAKIKPGEVIAMESAKMVPTSAGFKGWDRLWLGTIEECIDAAIHGQWKGELA